MLAPAVGYRFWRARPGHIHRPIGLPQAAPALQFPPGGGQLARRPRGTRLPPRPGRSPRSDRACGSGAPPQGGVGIDVSRGPRTITRSARRTCRAISLSTCQRSRGQNQFDAGRYRSGRDTQSARGSVKGVEPGRRRPGRVDAGVPPQHHRQAAAAQIPVPYVLVGAGVGCRVRPRCQTSSGEPPWTYSRRIPIPPLPSGRWSGPPSPASRRSSSVLMSTA